MPNIKNSDTSKRGFAAMSHEKVSEIAHKGGEARAKQRRTEESKGKGNKSGSGSHTGRGK